MEDDNYDTLCSFGNIPYTPAWYYKRFPGFFNVECYKILAAWEGGVPLKEQENEVRENKKRKLSSENLELDQDNELRSTIEREHCQSGSQFATSDQWNGETTEIHAENTY